MSEAGCYWLGVCYVSMTMVMFDYMCVQSFVITYEVLYAHSKGISSHCLRLIALVTDMGCCNDNGNVGLHVCAKFIRHTYMQCFMLIVKG